MTTTVSPQLVADVSLSWPSSWGPVPRFATRRTPGRPTFGPVVGRVSEKLGRPLYPWQQYVADVALEVMPDGSWAYDDVTMRIPRRAGKNALVEAIIVQRCVADPDKPASVWMTGQKRDNAVKRWDDLRKSLARSKFKEVRDLARSKISNAFEVMRFSNGSEFRPFAPDEDSMHGEDPDLVLVDELWALTARDRKLMQAGYRPSFAFKSAQEWKFSAAGRRGLSEWLEQDTELGRAAASDGVTHGRAYFEWGLGEDARDIAENALVDERVLDELLELVVNCHPRPGIRVDYLRDEFARDPNDFLRAYCGLDDLHGGADLAIPLPVFNRAQWREAEMAPEGPRYGLGVAVDPDGLESAIFAACRLPDGRGIVSRVEVAPGTRWAVGRALQIAEDWPDVAAVAVGNAGGERDIADALGKELGDKLIRLPIADDKAALTRFTRDISEGPKVFHDGMVDDSLLEALRVARVSRGLWERKPGVRDPYTALPAAHRALWAADHLPAPEPPKQAFRIF